MLIPGPGDKIANMPTSSGASTRNYSGFSHIGVASASSRPSVNQQRTGYTSPSRTQLLTKREKLTNNRTVQKYDNGQYDNNNNTASYYSSNPSYSTSSSTYGSYQTPHTTTRKLSPEAIVSKPRSDRRAYHLTDSPSSSSRIKSDGTERSNSSTPEYRVTKITKQLSSNSLISNESTHRVSVTRGPTVSLSRTHQNRNESCSSQNTDSVAVGEKGNVGLVNLGNTCFMNSVLQCLLNTKPLIDYIKSGQSSTDINKTTSSLKGSLINAYAAMVNQVWSDHPPLSLSPTSLKSAVQRFAPRFSGYNQQDSQEFLRYLLQGLHEDVNRVRTKPKYIEADEEAEKRMTNEQKASAAWVRYLNFDNSAIVDIFVGQLRSTLKCEKCQYESVTFDPFWDLSLPIPRSSRGVGIRDCMESFMKKETLGGDERPTCSQCKTRQTMTKSFRIQKFPKILVLHLKRFSGERYRSKLSTLVDFDVTGLDLSSFTADQGRNSHANYNLYGISNHVGSVYSGHYTAFCKHPYKQKWYQFNDSRVSSYSSDRVVSDEAYVLFYELSS